MKPTLTRLQRRDLLLQGKPIPTIDILLPRRKKPPITSGEIPEFPLRTFGSKVGFLTARDESGRETFRSKPFSIEPDTRPRPEFDVISFGNFFPSRSPAKALDSITLGDPRSRKRRSKIKGKKNGKNGKKKSKPKPLKSIFDLSF